jgi:hypothetical protein
MELFSICTVRSSAIAMREEQLLDVRRGVAYR